ncbi:BTB/POZ domain-containing protein At1g01640-like [Capsella rubella]|uniref:BTB/POZ domain-containing protein At1g01640-like n=1 Tax=Capsella rubella TaxID=81985 RepID=UPI000CD4BB52|nr:BTB/POZ domain-containing protein At1g01640-like [Capsella rubella]
MATNQDKFMETLEKAWKDEFEVDIWLQATKESPVIPCHRIILAAGAKTFKEFLEDSEVQPPYLKEKPVPINNLTHEQLLQFVRFLYTGSLEHMFLTFDNAVALYKAANMYDCPLLKQLCEEELTRLQKLDHTTASKIDDLGQTFQDTMLFEDGDNYYQ